MPHFVHYNFFAGGNGIANLWYRACVHTGRWRACGKKQYANKHCTYSNFFTITPFYNGYKQRSKQQVNGTEH